jgi:hypothetical protein
MQQSLCSWQICVDRKPLFAYLRQVRNAAFSCASSCSGVVLASHSGLRGMISLSTLRASAAARRAADCSAASVLCAEVEMTTGW